MSQKSGWQIMKDAAESLKDPTAKTRALKAAEEMRLEEQQRYRELVGRYYIAKTLDVIVVIISLISIGIVIYLFSQSLFEGFISFVFTGFLIRYLFKQRNADWSSSFFMWF